MTDWGSWATAWEAHMAAYLPGRDAVLGLIAELLADLVPSAAEVVELGAGTGTLAARVLEALPAAHVTAIDIDPLLCRIGQEVHADRADHLSWLSLDLRSPNWSDALPRRPDAVVSAMAMHVLGADGTRAVYQASAVALAPGGLVCNVDYAPASLPPRIGAAVAAQAAARVEAAAVSDFRRHDDALAAEPAVARLQAERRHFARTAAPDGAYLPLEEHVAELRSAGFADVATIWSDLDVALILALREPRRDI